MDWDPDAVISDLETKILGHRAIISGTVIQRVRVDNALLEQHGLAPTTRGREDTLVWCVGFGLMNMPKRFFFGLTIREAIEKVLAAITKEEENE